MQCCMSLLSVLHPLKSELWCPKHHNICQYAAHDSNRSHTLLVTCVRLDTRPNAKTSCHPVTICGHIGNAAMMVERAG
jgi:hypothetical protein